MDMINFDGLLIGIATFLIIGLFHPVVVKAEYYWGTKCWWIDPSIIYWGDIRKRKEKKLYAVDGDTEDAIYVYDLPTP